MQKPDIIVNKPIYHLEENDPMRIENFLPEIFHAVIHEQQAMYVITPFMPSEETPMLTYLMKEIAKYLKVFEAINRGSILKEEWRFFAKPILDLMPTIKWDTWSEEINLTQVKQPFFPGSLRQN